MIEYQELSFGELYDLDGWTDWVTEYINETANPAIGAAEAQVPRYAALDKDGQLRCVAVLDDGALLARPRFSSRSPSTTRFLSSALMPSTSVRHGAVGVRGLIFSGAPRRLPRRKALQASPSWRRRGRRSTSCAIVSA